MIRTKILGRNGNLGISPSVLLTNPKYPHNVGASLRAASCFGIKQIWFTGNRVKLDSKHRLPREERMKGYADVDLYQHDYPFEQFPTNITPVCIELVEQAEVLSEFEHPENPLYVFGPEDGSVDKMIKRHCHRFVAIPSYHCTNLSAAVYIVLYDRMMKRRRDGLEPIIPVSAMLKEDRGWVENDQFHEL